MPKFTQPQIPVPAWGDEFPGYLQIKLTGNAKSLTRAAKAGDTITFYTATGATVTATTMVTEESVEITTTSGTEYDTQAFTMPTEGVEVEVEEA